MKSYVIVLGLVFICLFIGACATTRMQLLPQLNMVDIPTIGKIETVELGDTLVSKGKIYTYDGIELKNKLSGGDGIVNLKMTLEPGDLVAKETDSEWIYYYPVNPYSFNAVPVFGLSQVGGLKIPKTGKKYPMLFFVASGASTKPNQEPDYIPKKIDAIDKPRFKQELIYNGKVGNYVKFLYRELSNDLMRPSFSQEIQYDLNESNAIGFKGVRIEIIEATNTLIKYKVLKNFPDLP